PRAALLLRLVAGLDFSHAAQVLGISENTYRFALERGLEQLHAAGFDFQELERLRDGFFDEVKQLPVEVIKHQELPAVELSEPVDIVIVEANETKKTSSRKWWLLMLVFAVGALAVWWWTIEQAAPVVSKPIALSDIQNAVIHPDYDVIANPEIQTQVEDLAFLSWLAAGAPEENFEVLKSGEISKPQETAPSDTGLETTDEN
ncbi:MAG: sigma-70 region 4 domain-containing protein, partial [Arenimonas sp.]